MFDIVEGVVAVVEVDDDDDCSVAGFLVCIKNTPGITSFSITSISITMKTNWCAVDAVGRGR